MGATEFSFSSSKRAHFQIHVCRFKPSVVPSKASRKSMHTTSITPYLPSNMYTLSSSMTFFPLAPALLMQIHYSGMALGPRCAKRGSDAGKQPGWGRQPLPLQVKATYRRKDSTYVHQKLPIRKENWYSFRVSRPLGEVFLVEWSTKFTLKQNTVGGRRKGKNTSLQPQKKNVRLWIFWCCYIWNVKNKKGAKGGMV